MKKLSWLFQKVLSIMNSIQNFILILTVVYWILIFPKDLNPKNFLCYYKKVTLSLSRLSSKCTFDTTIVDGNLCSDVVTTQNPFLKISSLIVRQKYVLTNLLWERFQLFVYTNRINRLCKSSIDSYWLV